MSDVAQMMADRGMNRPRVSEREIDRLMKGVEVEVRELGPHESRVAFQFEVYAANGIHLVTRNINKPKSEGAAAVEEMGRRQALAAARCHLTLLETWRLQCMFEQPLDRFSLIVELRRLRYLLRCAVARERDAKRERFSGNGSSPAR